MRTRRGRDREVHERREGVVGGAVCPNRHHPQDQSTEKPSSIGASHNIKCQVLDRNRNPDYSVLSKSAISPLTDSWWASSLGYQDQGLRIEGTADSSACLSQAEIVRSCRTTVGYCPLPAPCYPPFLLNDFLPGAVQFAVPRRCGEGLLCHVSSLPQLRRESLPSVFRGAGGLPSSPACGVPPLPDGW